MELNPLGQPGPHSQRYAALVEDGILLKIVSLGRWVHSWGGGPGGPGPYSQRCEARSGTRRRGCAVLGNQRYAEDGVDLKIARQIAAHIRLLAAAAAAFPCLGLMMSRPREAAAGAHGSCHCCTDAECQPRRPGLPLAARGAGPRRVRGHEC